MESLALTAAIVTGLAILTTVIRCELEQKHTKVYTVAEFNAKFGGVA